MDLLLGQAAKIDMKKNKKNIQAQTQQAFYITIILLLKQVNEVNLYQP